jgi:hypothetical protein
MKNNSWRRSPGRLAAAGLAIGVATYLGYAGYAFLRFGDRRRFSKSLFGSTLLDEIMPEYEVTERHEVRVAAPAEIAFSSACHLDLRRSLVIRCIFGAREALLSGKSHEVRFSRGLAEQAKAWGWSVLGERPGREIVFGAATRPWVANPTFRGLFADEFVNFDEPDYVKIAWTLAADPRGDYESVARTETRVITTSAAARSKFRAYWAFLSPGIILIRRVALAMVRAEAEAARRSVG